MVCCSFNRQLNFTKVAHYNKNIFQTIKNIDFGYMFYFYITMTKPSLVFTVQSLKKNFLQSHLLIIKQLGSLPIFKNQVLIR